MPTNSFSEVHSINPIGFNPVSAEAAMVMEPGSYLYVTGSLSNKFSKPISSEAAATAGFRVVESRPMTFAHGFGAQLQTSGQPISTTNSITSVYQKFP